jgi:hypothetical protein
MSASAAPEPGSPDPLDGCLAQQIDVQAARSDCLDSSPSPCSFSRDRKIAFCRPSLDAAPEASKFRQRTIEHVFGTLKAWMGATHFLTKTLPNVKTEMNLQVLAYNLKRAIKILGASTLIAEMKS